MVAGQHSVDLQGQSPGRHLLEQIVVVLGLSVGVAGVGVVAAAVAGAHLKAIEDGDRLGTRSSLQHWEVLSTLVIRPAGVARQVMTGPVEHHKRS